MLLRSLKGLNVAVTGASSGIGEAIAKSFAKEGCNVIILARREENLKQISEFCAREYNAKVIPVVLDLASKESVAKAAQKIGELFDNKLHILVNNSGRSGQRMNAMNANAEDWEKTITVNLTNTMRFTRYLLPCLKVAAPRSHVVFISSIGAKNPAPNMCHYSSSKHGVAGFAGSLFHDVRDLGIKVSNIMPGMVNTPMIVNNGNLDPSKMLQPEDVAQAAVWVTKCGENVCPTELILKPQRSPLIPQQ